MASPFSELKSKCFLLYGTPIVEYRETDEGWTSYDDHLVNQSNQTKWDGSLANESRNGKSKK